MTHPTLFILCGLPFSGKTTLSQKLSETLGCERIAFDWIWNEIYPVENPDLDKLEQWKEIRNLAKQRITQLITDGKSVIYDDVNPTKELRDEYRQVGRELQIPTHIIFIDVPVEEIKKRKKINLQTRARHDVTDHNFQKCLADFHRPDQEEILTIKPEDNIVEWIQNLKLIIN